GQRKPDEANGEERGLPSGTPSVRRGRLADHRRRSVTSRRVRWSTSMPAEAAPRATAVDEVTGRAAAIWRKALVMPPTAAYRAGASACAAGGKWDARSCGRKRLSDAINSGIAA